MPGKDGRSPTVDLALPNASGGFEDSAALFFVGNGTTTELVPDENLSLGANTLDDLGD